MSSPPLFIIFVDTTISIKLINLIEQGIIHAIIYTHPAIALILKKIFGKIIKGKFQIQECNLPFTFNTFNILLTSRTFWDNIDNNYPNLYILYNPKALGMQINLKTKKNPFFIIPLEKTNINIPLEKTNINKLIWENPSLSDETIAKGFIVFIKNKFAKNTIEKFTKTHILNIRKKLKMKNNEHIERQVFTPFYIYFYHNMLELGYNN